MNEVVAASLHGVLLAMGLIIPLGVQNVFIFNQGANNAKLRHALPSIITASVCDTMLIALAVCGVSAAVLKVEGLKLAIFVLGFFFLLYMGYATWIQKPSKNKKQESVSAMKQIFFTMSVSILNPHAIIDTIAVIGTNSLKYDNDMLKLAYTISCIAISWIWFFVLALAGHALNRIDDDGYYMKLMNKIAAIIIWALALYLGISILSL